MPVTNELDTLLQKIREFKKASSRLSNLDEFSKHFEVRRKVFEGFGEDVSPEYKDIELT